MPLSECDHCGGTYHWKWEEAFEKFGFGDGDGQIETWQVADVLTDAGYEVEIKAWGLHNTIITSIKKAGKEIIPHDTCILGYDDPREFLPQDIVKLLDEALPG